MTSFRSLLSLLTVFVLILAPNPSLGQTKPAVPNRKLELFDRGWKFLRGEAAGAEAPTFDDSKWRSIDLPHDFSIEGIADASGAFPASPFNHSSKAGGGGGYLDGGVAWYRKTFTVPASSSKEKVTILFDGAYMNADVYLNGQKLGTHPYGFTSFCYDLTPLLKFGSDNVLSVRLQVDQPSCRWYSGAGIYRHVWLITTAPVHVAQWGTYITTPKADANGSDVTVSTDLVNDSSEAVSPQVTTVLNDASGQEVAHNTSPVQRIAPNGKITVVQNLHLSHADLWTLEKPTLYHAISEVKVAGEVVDGVDNPFGIRSILFTKDKGFFLNGQHVSINGVCDHHDLGCLGSAAYRRAIQRQIEVLKSFGCNAIRTSHNPPSPELLELCDQMGMLVMDEAFDEWKANHNKYGYGQFFDKWSEPDLCSMLDRDRNHPSIVLYSIGNEIIEGRKGDPVAGPISVRLTAICHREDPTRPVTSACPSPDKDWSSGLAPALDVFGINYNTGWYGKNNPATQVTPKPGDTGYYGQLPLVGSETSSQVDSRCEYNMTLDPQGNVKIVGQANNQVSSYDYFHPGWANSGEADLLALKGAPWVAGEFVWTGFDYIGEPTPFPWPSRSSYFGIVDLAGFPKDRYYLYKSQWSQEPVVHILPMSWNWPGFEGKTIPVHVFTNADSVELFLNGKSLGVKNYPADIEQSIEEAQDRKTKVITLNKHPGLHLGWDVAYQPGELKAVAKKGGQIVATDVVATADAPAKILLSADRSTIVGSGQDLSFIKVTVVDKNGVVCPNADNEVHFSLSGTSAKIAGLDDGDATNLESFQGDKHKVYHGLGLVVLKSNYGASGPVTLTASADGIAPASCEISVEGTGK